MKQDIVTINQESLTIEIQASKIISSRTKNITKKGARYFEKGKIYSNSMVGEISNEELISNLKNNLGVGLSYDYELPKRENIKFHDDEAFNRPLTKIQESIHESLDLLGNLKDQFIFSGKFSATKSIKTLTNDEGVTQETKTGLSEWHYIFKKVGSPNLMDGWFGEELNRDLNISNTIKNAIPYLNAYKNEIKFENGKYPVLFLEGDTLLRKTAESLVAEKYCQGSALYSGKLNQKIFSDKFSLYDVCMKPKMGLVRPFDMEGVVRKINELPLIENGVFKNVIADLRNAKKFNLEVTGNGQRSYDSAVSTGFNALTVGKGQRTTREILNSLDACIVVFMGFGGDFTDKGDFSTPLQLAYLLKKGEIIGRLPQLTVKTLNDEMFGNRLIEIASDGFNVSNYNPSIFTEMDVYLN